MQGIWKGVCKCSYVMYRYVYRWELKVSWSVTPSFSPWEPEPGSNWTWSLTDSQQDPELLLSPLTQLPELGSRQVVTWGFYLAFIWGVEDLNSCLQAYSANSLTSWVTFWGPHYRLFWKVIVDTLQCFVVVSILLAKRMALIRVLGFEGS